jgi:hypothetical protein
MKAALAILSLLILVGIPFWFATRASKSGKKPYSGDYEKDDNESPTARSIQNYKELSND